MGFGIAVRVWGDYACFTRPEMKVERVSYDIITPSAARGIIEAVYWKPSIRWVIDKIHVLNEIEFTNVRRNEVGKKISTHRVKQQMKQEKGPIFFMSSNDNRQQRAGMILKNVDYVIEAHFEFVIAKPTPEDTVEKHYNMVLRRLRKGQYFQAPYLGTREFGANFVLIEDTAISRSHLKGKKDLGWMLYDLDFSNPDDIKPMFFKAVLEDGVLDLNQIEVVR